MLPALASGLGEAIGGRRPSLPLRTPPAASVPLPASVPELPVASGSRYDSSHRSRAICHVRRECAGSPGATQSAASTYYEALLLLPPPGHALLARIVSARQFLQLIPSFHLDSPPWRGRPPTLCGCVGIVDVTMRVWQAVVDNARSRVPQHGTGNAAEKEA